MSESEYGDVRKLDLFARMAAEHFHALMRGAYVQTFPPHVALIAEGEPSDFLHIVMTGTVDLFTAWNGRETSMATVRPISTFILAATIRNAPYLMSARTMEKSRIALIPSADVRAVFDADGNFARAIVSELATCYRSVIKSHKDLKLRNSLERVANFLLRQQKRAGGKAVFDLDFEKRRQASVLGMTPESLSRAIKRLRIHGVTVDRNRVTVTDQEGLERLAKPNPLINDVHR